MSGSQIYRQGAQATVSVGVRDAPSDAFLAGAIQSAARSGRFSVEAGTRAAAPFPAPLSPLAASFLRCAPDRFHLTKPNTFQHNREASVATLRWCSGSSRNAVRLPSEQAFSFAGIPKHRTTSLFDNPSIAAAAAAPPKATAQDFPPLNRWEATSEPASTIRLAVRPKTLCALQILSFFSIRQSLFGQAINGE